MWFGFSYTGNVEFTMYLQYFGHISQRYDGMESLVVQGKVKVRGPRGRSQKR